MGRNKICCIFNLAPHYRAPIYKLMDRELHCDFYFGDKVNTPIVEMDVKNLRGFKKILPRKTYTKWNYYWLSGSLKPIFGTYRYYIITGDSKYLTNWFLLILALFGNKKVIAWSHGMKGNKEGRAKFLDSIFYKLCYKVLLYGHYSRNYMLSEGFHSNKLCVIYNSMDYDKQLKVRNKLQPSSIYDSRFKNGNPVLLYIGRIQKSKKIDMIIRAMSVLKKKGQACNLIIIGDDVDATGLEHLVLELNLENYVWFYGACYDENEIAELIYNADVCVSPGPVGLTAIHAMTYGTPVITNNNLRTQMPEHEVVLKGETGDFFEDGLLNDLANKVSEWINLPSARREDIRKKAYQIIDDKYNPHYQINLLKQLMQSES